MFVLPEELAFFAAVPVPEPTALRSPIMGYLDDGCEPEIGAAEPTFQRAVNEADCGRGRKREQREREPGPEREPVFPTLVPDRPPLAFFAQPDVPIVIDRIDIPRLPPERQPIQRFAMFWPGPALSNGFPANSTEPTDPSAVPEPRTWALMILGLGAVGGLLRRSRDRLSATH